jgi:hypothetical protein
MMAIDDITKRKREMRAREIAQDVDPQAGGFFPAALNARRLPAWNTWRPINSKKRPSEWLRN